MGLGHTILENNLFPLATMCYLNRVVLCFYGVVYRAFREENAILQEARLLWKNKAFAD